MKQFLLSLFLFGAVLCHHSSFAQSRFYRNNQIAIDRAKALLSKSCHAYESVKPTSAGQVKADKKLIAFLNEFYNNDIPVTAIAKKLDAFLGRKWAFDTVNLGSCMKYQVAVRSEGNIQAVVSFTVFQQEVVYKRISFETSIKTRCVSPAKDVADLVDINYLDIFCLSQIDFPVSFCAGCGKVECDATNYSKIKSDDASGYKLIPADSTNINFMVWYRNDTYLTENADADFITIANNHNTYLLYRLLFSPNQVAAICSLEAITYLEGTGVIKLPDYIAQKIEEIKNSPLQIAWQQPDLVKKGGAYKDLNITKEKIIAKYSKSP